MSYISEFPDFPATDMPTIPAKWEDISWHNDSCPSFECKEHGFRLWVEYADEAKRDFKGGKRFSLYPLNEEGEQGESLLDTDDWAEMLALMNDYTA